MNILTLGSPPRMRGLLASKTKTAASSGITPAHAGLTGWNYWQYCHAEDHPRACGAYAQNWVTFNREKGSPPRMRGLQVTSEEELGEYGITPAHAGLTNSCPLMLHVYRDHPRACGAYGHHVGRSFYDWGSPPRMRGLPASHCFEFGYYGITPAHAGLTYRF